MVVSSWQGPPLQGREDPSATSRSVALTGTAGMAGHRALSHPLPD